MRVANRAWALSGTAAVRRFRRGLQRTAETQHSWLMRRIARDAPSAFGRAHGFSSINDYASFCKQVPLTEWREVEPWVGRIVHGEAKVLCTDAVSHLMPTSGSTGARKLVPSTTGLRDGFTGAVAPWLADLRTQRPSIIGGPAYWSISPLSPAEAIAESSAVPIGYDDDTEYLGGVRARLVRRVLPVPTAVRFASDRDSFTGLTLLALLRERSLRLISVWHPTFLELLVGAAAGAWEQLTQAVAEGTNPWPDALPGGAGLRWRARPDPVRATELDAIGPEAWPRWWPDLQVISCWGEQAAAPGCARLARLCPGVLVQAKGLIATEGVVTVPIGDEHPLAVSSHFFEFIAEDGDIRLAHQLERSCRYEVIITNGGGLWRYRLGDLVECTGHLARAPSLRFVGRIGRVSDLRGEKLSEAFVADVLGEMEVVVGRPVEGCLRAWDDGVAAGYELILEGGLDGVQNRPSLADIVEHGLRRNPHYALARRLGQLAPLRVRGVPEQESQDDLGRQAAARGLRLGDVKPRVLVPLGDPQEGA